MSKSKAPPAASKQPQTEKAVTQAEVDKLKFINRMDQTFTAEAFNRFVRGEISMAELTGVTAEQAYAVAEYAYTLFEQGRVREARTIFEGLVVQNPADAYMHLMLGAIYWKLDMPEESVEEYGISIQLQPNNIAAFTNRGEILLQHGQFDDALKDLTQAVKLDKRGDDPHGLRARALVSATAEVMKSAVEKKKKK